MKFAIVAVLLAAVARGQTLIPTNITTGCSTFLTTLNSDPTLNTCVTPLINATASFSPTSGANLTTSTINYTLASLCKATAGCSDATIRSWLSQFYSACYDELTSTTGYNAQVRELYDVLYVVNPLKGAVCAIDSANQDYCVNEIRAAVANSTSSTSASASASASSDASSSSASAAASASASSGVLISNLASAASVIDPVTFAANNLYITLTSSLARRFHSLVSSRDAQIISAATVIAPNTTTYGITNLPFLFLLPSYSASTLCTPCTREILVPYVKWETAFPYALGLSASPILGGQSALWAGIASTCGTTFISGITAEAGSLAAASSNATSSAESRWSAPGGNSAGVTAVLGVAAVAGAMAMFA